MRRDYIFRCHSSMAMMFAYCRLGHTFRERLMRDMLFRATVAIFLPPAASEHR